MEENLSREEKERKERDQVKVEENRARQVRMGVIPRETEEEIESQTEEETESQTEEETESQTEEETEPQTESE